MNTIGWIGLHAHRPPERGGTDWNSFCQTPRDTREYLYKQLTERPHDEFYLHQPAPWTGGLDGMATGQFYAVGKNAETPQPAWRDAICDAIIAAKIRRPEIRIGIYGGLKYSVPHRTVYQVGEAGLWHPMKVGHLWGMFERNLIAWREATTGGVTEWWLDAGSKLDRRDNMLLFVDFARGLGFNCGIEAFAVEGWDEEEETSLNPTVSVFVQQLADARFVHKHGPWPLPDGSQRHVVMLHKKVRVGGVELPADSPALLPFYQLCKNLGYHFGCDYRYDDFLKDNELFQNPLPPAA